jgi:hypothetical protein
VPGVRNEDELMHQGTVIQFGVPPNRIDLINEIEGVNFQEARDNRVNACPSLQDKEIAIYYIGLAELIKNKEAVGRHKDLEDLKFLNKVSKK